MARERIHSRWWRARKVYAATFRIDLDYLLLFLGGWLFGKRYLEKRITRVHIRSAFRMRRTFLELQGLFIKIGQLVSILSSFLPEEFRKPLEDFQDKAPARPFEEIERRIIEEFKAPPESVFASFEKEPLASASIGQVHRARLHDGTEVVVKIQHAHIPQMAAVDLDLFDRVMRLVAWLFGLKGLEHVAAQVKAMIRDELDYGNEARNMDLIRHNLAGVIDVIIPETFPAYCTPQIITSRYYDGVKINNLEKLEEWELDRHALARRLLEMCSHMALVDGVYHADPHPGNLLVTREGKMILLDFGAVSVVHPRMKEGLARLVEAAVRGDTGEIVEAMQFMGFVARGREAGHFAERILEFIQEFFREEVQMDSLNFRDIRINADLSSVGRLLEIFSVREMANSFQIPKDYILLNRMILLAGGVSAELAPQLNPLEVVRPYLRDYVMGEDQGLPKYVLDFVKKNLSNLLTLPLEMRKVLDKARKGQLEMNIRGLEESVNLLYLGVRQLVYTFLVIAAGTLAFYARQEGWTEVWTAALVVAALFGWLWLRAALAARRFRRW